MNTENSYQALCHKLKNIADGYRTIGHSELGFPIYMFIKKGRKNNGKTLAVFATTHAREHITTDLTAKLFADYTGNATVHYVPAINPDGLLLARGELAGLLPQPLWKSNIRGVDLNTNFDIGFGEGASNVTTAGAENYIGPYPFSEKETQAIRGMLTRKRYDAVLSYHSLGEEIYYGFRDNKLGKELAERLGKLLNYTVKETPESAGGLKDYCVSLGVPAVTIEVGKSQFGHPYPQSGLPTLQFIHKNSWEQIF